MGRGKRSIWRCRSFRWLQRGWFHWVDPILAGRMQKGRSAFSHCWLMLHEDWRWQRGQNYGWIGLKISPILSGRIQRASCFSMLPEVPNLWNVHFVILKHKMKRGGQREHNLWPLQTLWNYHPSRRFDRKELLKKVFKVLKVTSSTSKYLQVPQSSWKYPKVHKSI